MHSLSKGSRFGKTAVDPKLHSTGLGKEIVGFCIDTAKKRGLRAIRLDIVPGNAPAKHLYESLGFTYIGDEDVRPDVEHVSKFSLYELNFDAEEDMVLGGR